MEGTLTVFFDPPYWVGIYEVMDNNQYRVARHIFGAEPSEPELLKFALTQYSSLKFSQPAAIDLKNRPPENYKRRMREIRAQMKVPRISTRAQEIIRQEYESKAVEKQENTRENQLQEATKKYRLKKEKRAEKHRGH